MMRRSFIGEIPISHVRSYRGPKDTLETMATHALGKYGERSIYVRKFVEWVVGQVFPKDYLGEVLAVRNVFVQPSPVLPWVPLIHYVNDPRHLEFVKTPERVVKEILELGYAIADCDDTSTLAAACCLCIGREVELVAMGFTPHQLSHVAVRVKEPKSGRWIILDGVAGPREKEAAGKAKELLIKSLD